MPARSGRRRSTPRRGTTATPPSATPTPADPSYAFGCACNLQYPRLQGATPSFGGAWEAVAEWLHVGSQPDAGVTLPAETTLDLQESWRFAPGWQVQARLANATDEDLQRVCDHQRPGRQARLVLRWELGW